MTITNFTLQDVIGISVGFTLFALIFIPPGHVIGVAFNFFDFRSRRYFVRLGIALLLSIAITPIVFFLAYRLASEPFALLIIFIFAIIFLFQFFRGGYIPSIIAEIYENKQIRIALGIMAVWVVLVVISLIDIQIGKRLYFNITAFDYQTRVSVINAITRTGVPPLNPSYYPGEPAKLTFLYYFWYILCSLVDRLGGDVVGARTALMASVIWAGIALMATIAFYLRLRNPDDTAAHWRIAIIGICLLAVTGLDIFGSTFYILFPKYLYGYFIDGDIEHWNEQITAWMGTAMWTPHHLVSLLNCIMGWLLVSYHINKVTVTKIGAAFLAGIAFASAFGLSSWVTSIFVIFWIYLIFSYLISWERIKNIWILFVPGIVAAISVLPFFLDLISGGGSGGISAIEALSFEIRWFRPALYFIIGKPIWLALTANFLLLPLNYFLELGFFFFAGTTWIPLIQKKRLEKTKMWREEVALLGITILLTSFTRSTLIANNDFGWRGWLPGQFILLIWGTDVLAHFWRERPINWKLLLANPMRVNRIKYTLLVLIALGVLTTIQDLALLRIWPIMVDAEVMSLSDSIHREEYMGSKTFEARDVFSQIDKSYPLSTIVQFNPEVGLNRATGLYRTRGTVFSAHSLYGVPKDVYTPLKAGMEEIFHKTRTGWEDLDTDCEQNKIDILIIANGDELWQSIPTLAELRQPIYTGSHYVAFECGN